MDRENNNKSEYNKRIQMLERLKQEVLELTSRTTNDFEEKMQQPFRFLDEKDNNESNSVSSQGKSFTKATAAGRAMSDQERGYTSAIMLGIMSFIIELAFLAIAFFMYQ